MFAYFPDSLALLFFVTGWAGYSFYVRKHRMSRPGLASLMHDRRLDWMREMAARDVRIVDSAIMNTLQAGTAFFASTSILAIGGAATLLHSTDDAIKLFSDLPFTPPITRRLWEIKTIGLAVIYGYAFFQFAWAYRLFNYAAILIGATPSAASPDCVKRDRAAKSAADMNTVAGSHFVSGQRAIFFSFAYLGWFLGPVAFVLTTLLIITVLYNRQYHSDALKAVLQSSNDKDAL